MATDLTRRELRLGDGSLAWRHASLGSIAEMQSVFLDTNVVKRHVLGRTVVSRRRCIVLIGLEIGSRSWLWFETKVVL
jgi:hypothetical protein